jgi:hypothetical protein
MKRLLAALVMLLSFGSAARADDRPSCAKVENPDPSIRACTNIIAA